MNSQISLAKAHRRKNIAMLICISIPLVFLIIFYILPVLIMGVYSLWDIDNFGNLIPTWNFEQYENVFRNPVYFKLLFKSIMFAVANSVLCFLIAYPLAYFIAKVVKPKWRYTLLFLIMLPSWTSFLIRTFSWMLMLGEKGVINTLLMGLGIIDEPLRLAFTPAAVLISLVHIYLPYMMLPIYNSIEKVDDRLVEAADSLGANKIQSFFQIVFKLSLPGVVSGSIIVLIPSIGEYVIPMILGGNSGMMYSNAVTAQFLITNWPLGAALAFVLLVVIVIIFSIYNRVMKIEELWSGL